MIGRLARVLVALLCLACAPPAGARAVWFAETAALSRLDVDSGALQTVPMPEAVLGIAPASSNSAWVLTKGALIRVDEALAEHARVGIDPVEVDGTVAMAADPIGEGVWVATGRQIAGFDRAGRRTQAWTAAEPVRALAVAGPSAIFVASAIALTQYDADGSVVARLDLVNLRGSDVLRMHVDALAGTIWLVRSGALVQVDVFAGLVPRKAYAIQGPDATALEPANGNLTSLTGRTVTRYSRNALPPAPAIFASESLDAPAGVDIGMRRPLLWFGDRLSLGAIDLDSGIVHRIAETESVYWFAAPPLPLQPSIQIDAPAGLASGDDVLVQMRYGALCDGTECVATPSYLSGLRLDAYLGNRSVSALLTRDIQGEGASGQVPNSIWPAGESMRAWVTDAYGNRSDAQSLARREATGRAGPANGAVTASLATISITAPLNNATYTAPASVAVTTAAGAGSGATLSKVELFSNGTLIGTKTAAPFNFTWSNVQVGTYSLTARVTDSLAGTATSAAITISVKAGTMATPIAAYLLNDTWASPGIVTDAIGVHNGAASGTVTSIASPAALPKPDTCRAASVAGGAIDIASLPVSIAANAKTTVAFWMYWTGADAVIPIGWATQGLLFSAGSFGFSTINNDVYGFASTSLLKTWHHVVAEFTNGSVTANKIYIDGVTQILTQRVGTPIVANAVVAPNLRVGGLVGSTTNRFGGNLDEIKVFTRALTPTEVSAEFAAANACGTAPTATLTAPANNATIVAPATIAMTANAAATGTAVAKVEFYSGSTLLGTDTTAPYAYTWPSVAVGTYALKAKAIDAKGMGTISAVANVRVKANVAPAVSLTAPANNSTFTAQATIGLAATASDSDGAVAKVDFYQGATKLGTATVAPYTFIWTNVAGGTYALTAKATDDKGAVTTSAVVNAKVDRPPTVSITAPANNAIIVLPATITINASASDADGTVSKVDFYHDGVLLGTDTTSPYSYAWTNATPGTYLLTAKATDNLGVITTSAPISITANANRPPTVFITSPVNGAKFVSGVPVTIAATASDPDGAVTKVDFFANAGAQYLLGTDTAAPYSVTQALNPGNYTLTAASTDNKGATTISAPVSVAVAQNQPPAIALTSPANGHIFVSPTSPPDITLTATASDPDGNLVAVRFYKQAQGPEGDADSVLLATVTTPPYQFVWRAVPFTDPSGETVTNYDIWAEATDNSNAVSASDGAVVTVLQSTPRTIAITAPYSDPNGTRPIIFAPPATIVLTAVSPEVDFDAIAKVDFVADGTVIATVASANGSNGEFVTVWRNVPAGTKSVTARLTDVFGSTVTSDPVSIQVSAPLQPMSVVLQSPTTGQVFSPYLAGTDVPMLASVTDPNGPVTQVSFYCDYRLVALSSIAPYSGTCLSAAPGVHALTAHATDAAGSMGDSVPTYVTVPFGSARPLVAVMTSPSPTGTYTTISPITLSVDAFSPDHAISQVDYYVGPYLIATATQPPFSVTGYSAAGQQTYHAVAHIPFSSAVTLPITINVTGSGGGASVALTSPAEGQQFMAGSNIPLSVSVSDPGHVIKQMSYYVGDQPNTTVVATSTQAPYSATWAGVAAGSYTLTAVGIYTSGGQATSSPVHITVDPNGAPNVTITSPKAGAGYTLAQPIAITAQAYSGAYPLSRIDFIADGAVIGSVPVTGSVTSASIIFNWNGASTGPHMLSAKAIATDGSGVTAPTVAISVSDLGVELIEPFAGQNYLAPGDIRITANPSETGGTITAVDFYGDGVLLGSRATAPYTYLWRGVGAGSHTVAAAVRDSAGLVQSSPTLSVAVLTGPAMQVDAGIDGSSVADDTVSVSGTVQAPPNSAVIVNGQLAALDRNGQFFATDVQLQSGSNVVTVVLNTQDAEAVTKSVTVNSSGTTPFKVTLDPQEGLAPLATTLTISNRGDVPFNRIEIDTNDDGAAELTLTSLTNQKAEVTLNYPTPGTSTVRVSVFDASNNLIYLARRKIRAVSPAELGVKVIDVYASMVNRLAANNPSAAVKFFTGDMQANYSNIFSTLGASLPAVAAQLGTLIDGVISEDTAELALVRDTSTGKQTFMIYLIRGGDGLWRIESM